MLGSDFQQPRVNNKEIYVISNKFSSIHKLMVKPKFQPYLWSLQFEESKKAIPSVNDKRTLPQRRKIPKCAENYPLSILQQKPKYEEWKMLLFLF